MSDKKSSRSVRIDEVLSSPESPDQIDSDNDVDTPQLQIKSSDKGKERWREPSSDREDVSDINGAQITEKSTSKKTKPATKAKQPKEKKAKGTSRKRKHTGGASESGIAPSAPSSSQMEKNKRELIESLHRDYNPSMAQPPVAPIVLSLMSQEQKAARMLALTVLDGRMDDETYRWPVREHLLPSVPKSSYMDTNTDVNFFEQQGMGFVEELTGVPKTEGDYSGDDEDEAYNSSDDEYALYKRRIAKKLRKQRQEQRANERDASNRLEQVHSFLKEEFVAYAHQQYRKGIPHRIKDLYSFQKQTLPPFRRRAVRAIIGDSKAGDEIEDELSPIQENAAAFAAEDSLRRILDRLPYAIRQGALGEVPEYVKLGVPKPVSSIADYERNWDTVMAAASIAGVEDRILKKVGMRMKNLLSQSKHSRYYEPPPKAKFATAKSSENLEDLNLDNILSQTRKHIFRRPPPPKEFWRRRPEPFYLSREFVDPLDPKYSADGIVKNVRKRRAWISHKSGGDSDGDDDKDK
ncbi:hypothetical protein BGZ46_000534 [Entomortierella lignicola]|nr:hypothetical protein BGZ46_000534 [Entomortierella lignicola]